MTINGGSLSSGGTSAIAIKQDGSGTINITGNSPFDYDGEAKYTGGTMIVNGSETTTITNQFMTGGMQGGAPGQMPEGNMQRGQRR